MEIYRLVQSSMYTNLIDVCLLIQMKDRYFWKEVDYVHKSGGNRSDMHYINIPFLGRRSPKKEVLGALYDFYEEDLEINTTYPWK